LNDNDKLGSVAHPGASLPRTGFRVSAATGK